MKANKALIIAIASDASESGARKNETNAERKSLPVLRCMDGAELGAGIGMEFCAIVSVEAEPFAAQLKTLADQLEEARGR
jgi:ribosomal protein L7Ae-like RNA K-turn-binding protein